MTSYGPYPFTHNVQKNAKRFNQKKYASIKPSVALAIKETTENVKNAVKTAQHDMKKAEMYKEKAANIIKTAVKNAKSNLNAAKNAEEKANNAIKAATNKVKATNNKLKNLK